MTAERPAGAPAWEQRLLRNPASPPADLSPEYQELKFTLHRKLLDRINLEALAGIDNDRIRAEVRQAVLAIVENEPNLLTAVGKAADQRRGAARGLRPGSARTAARRTRASPTSW